jgi:2-amino-4-hydroxy-6-hydroxymethyldihydropteridine diphosphokinase
MSLFIATGTNIGDKKQNLIDAKNELMKYFEFIAESRIYTSKAIEYTQQDDFLNQVIEFKLPKISPNEVMSILLEIELKLGRRRDIPKGPRTIDLDIIFFSDLKIQTDLVNIPHPRLFERSFVVLPLSELPGFAKLKKHFSFPSEFSNQASPI